MLGRIRKVLYGEMAKKFKRRGRGVERGMGDGIEVGWRRGKIDWIWWLFGYSVRMRKAKARKSELIGMVGDKVRLEDKGC